MELLLQALVEVRNGTILWEKGEEVTKLREVHQIANNALKTYGWIPIEEGFPLHGKNGLSDPVIVVYERRGEKILATGQYIKTIGQWIVSPAPMSATYPHVTHWQYAILPPGEK